MKKMVRFVLLAGALALEACQEQPAPDTSAPGPQVTGTPRPAALPTPQASNPGKTDPFAGENDGYPDLATTPVTEEAAKGVKGARAILLSWARGIELREFDQSWTMMGDNAKAQLSKSAFNALFHPLRDLTVSIPDGSMEGAAGSSYYTVPTTVTGTSVDGTRVTMNGDVVLRRTNDVPGAKPEQLRWHIEKVGLKPVS